MVRVILKKYILFSFINIGIIIFVSVILKKIKIIYSQIFALFAKFSKDFAPIVPISTITSISLKSH